MSCLRTSRQRAAASARRLFQRPATVAVLASLVLVCGLFAGCEDDLPDPTMGRLTLTIRSDVPGLATGTRVLVDGETFVDSLSAERMEMLLEAGPHTLQFLKDCVRIEPSATMEIELRAGVEEKVDVRLVQESAMLSITSEPAGLEVWLDGERTGQRTPAAFPCVHPGAHEVEVRPGSVSQLGFDVQGDSTQTVQVGGSGTTTADFVFEVAPIAQPRGVLMEIFTATYCPNCPVADEAGVELNRDATLDPEQFVAVQVHVPWGGTDPMHNGDIASRMAFYDYDGASAPSVWFNGGNRIDGAAHPELKELYRSKAMLTYGQASPAALYWTNVRTEGDLLRADLRFVAVGQLPGTATLHAFFSKDSLQATNPFGVEYFDAVVRDYITPIDLASEGATASGAFLDVPVEFDLAQDTRWVSKEIRLVAFVQDDATRETLQMRQARLRLP